MKKKRFLALLLSLVMAFCMEMPQVYAETTVGEKVMTSIPGTVKVEKDYDETFLSVTGFAEGMVQDRSHYYDEYVVNGYKDTENYVVVDEDYYENDAEERISVAEYEVLDTEAKTAYTLVTSEEQFCYGVSKARVIEVRVDLELGYKYLENNSIPNHGVITPVTDYEKGNEPITSPVLMEVGVSSLAISSHTTIFSPNGSMLEHVGVSLNDVEDVVIRNIQFQGLFEWDDAPQDVSSASPGGRKRYGWCYVSCNNAKGVWLDHCTFGYAFDGNVDLKNDAQVSITWCQIGVQDTEKGEYTGKEVEYEDYKTGCDLWKSIVYMENQYQAGNGFQVYKIFRDNGATMEEIFNYACMHSKVHLVGSGEDDYETNPLNAITLAYNQYKDTAQRIPMIRQGNGHMFNCYLNSDDYLNAAYNASDTFNVAREKVRESGYSTYGLNRALSVLCGASVGADTCVFDGFSSPAIGGELVTGGRFKGAINYQLIVNSSIRNNGSDDVYVGSSWDNEGNNPFNREWGFEANSYIDTRTWKWSEWKKMTKTESEASEDVYYVPESLIANLTDGEFYKQYYIGRDELGYEYQTFSLEDVKTNTELYSGAGKVTLENAGEWTKLYYGQEADEHLVQFEGGGFEGAKNRLYKENTALGELPVPTRNGYTFLGWFEGTYQDVEGEYKLVYGEEPVNGETLVTGEMHLYDKWEVNKYTVRFDAMNGSEAIIMENISHGTSVEGMGGLPANPIREGFAFQGWYSLPPEEGYGAKIYSSTKITANATYYAKWRPTVVDVIFNSNGGSNVATMEDCGYNTTITLPEAPVKDGYKFEGWFYDEACTKEFTATTKLLEKLSVELNLNGSLTLYAKWAMKGDVNDDNVVDANDALVILKYVAKMDVTISELQLQQADVDGGDGNVDANDALKVLKYVAKMIDGFDS